MAIVPAATVYSALTVEQMQGLRQLKLFRAFLKDGLDKGSPLTELGDLFGSFEFGPGFSEDSVRGTVFEGFYDPRWGLRVGNLRDDRGHVLPMAKWNPAGDVTDWFTRRDISHFLDPSNPNWPTVLGQMPWVWPTDRGVHWLYEMRTRDGKKSGIIDYFDSFRRYCLWLVENPLPSLPSAFLSLEWQEREEFLAQALQKVMSLDDWLQVKKNRRWRIFIGQLNARRQYTDGKTEIVQHVLMEWAWTSGEILASGGLWLQDALSAEKPMGLEKTLDNRDLSYDVAASKKPTKVWIVGAFLEALEALLPSDTAREVADKLARNADKTTKNRRAAEDDWKRKVYLARAAKIKADDDYPDVGEGAAAANIIRLGPSMVVWPNLDPKCSVAPVWSVAKRLSHRATFDPATNSWNWRLREEPMPEAEQNLLWDKISAWLRIGADRSVEAMLQNRVRDGILGFSHGDVLRAAEKGNWFFQRQWSLLVATPFDLRSVTSIRDPGPDVRGLTFSPTRYVVKLDEMQTWRDFLGDASIKCPWEVVRVLRRKFGAEQVAVVPGWDEDPDHGFANMMRKADRYVDPVALLLTEINDTRGYKGLTAEEFRHVYAFEVPPFGCWHPYDPKGCRHYGDGIRCDGWLVDGWENLKGEEQNLEIGSRRYEIEPPVFWFLRVRFMRLAEKVQLSWRSSHGDKIKWRLRAKRLGYPVPESIKSLEKDAELIGGGTPLDMMSQELSLPAKLLSGLRQTMWPFLDDLARIFKGDEWFEYEWSRLVQRCLPQVLAVYNDMFKEDGRTWEYDEVLGLIILASEIVDERVMWDIKLQV